MSQLLTALQIASDAGTADPTTYGQKAGRAIALGAGAGGGAAGAGAGIGMLFGKVVEAVARQPEMRNENEPRLSDLRESGAIEQDADLVMFIYRDEYYNEDSERPGEADLIIAKHRNGAVGKVTLTFQKEYPKFMNYAGERYAQ